MLSETRYEPGNVKRKPWLCQPGERDTVYRNTTLLLKDWLTSKQFAEVLYCQYRH